VSIQHQIEDLLEVKIDLAEGKALKPLVKAHAMSEKIDVF
jgi:predicted nucleotidyltransferase